MDRARRNSLASVATAAVGVGTALLATPLIISYEGSAGYGVWAIALAVVIYLGILEAGFAPVAQRRVAMALGSGDRAGAARVFWSTLVLYMGLGLLGGAAVYLLAPVVIPLFDFPPALEQQAVDLLRLVAFAIPLGLLMAALTNALQGAERFTAVSVTAAAGSAAYLAALVVLIDQDVGLAGLGWAVIVQQLVLVLLRAVLLVEIARTRPGLVSRSEAREMLSLSARLQVTTVSLIVNGQSDRVVSGLVSPPTTVAQVSVAAQVAEAGRLIAAAPLVPATNRFAALEGAGETVTLRELFARTDRTWVTAVTGAVVIGACCAVPLVEAWLGTGFRQAGVFAAVLVVAYGSSIGLGMRSSLLRALGRPGLESRTALVLMGLNLLFTVPLAFAFAAPGVVAGTLLAYLAGGAWFVRRFSRAAPGFKAAGARELAVAIAWGLPAGVAGGAWCFAAIAVVPTGWALIPVALGMAAASLAFLGCALRTGPRGLLVALRGA